MSNKKILVLPGDGIGNEVMSEVLHIMDWMAKNKTLSFDVSERLVGGTAYDKEGDSISDSTMQEALDCDAILFGAVGGSKWDGVDRNKRPEAALLRLRKELDLFANLRPAVVFDALADSSSLKLDIVKGLDILTVRELTSGVYFGQPRGVSKIDENEEKAIDTQSYTTSEIDRISRVAFDLAKLRNNKVTSVEKSNVMETGMFWKKVVTKIDRASKRGNEKKAAKAVAATGDIRNAVKLGRDLKAAGDEDVAELTVDAIADCVTAMDTDKSPFEVEKEASQEKQN